MAARTFLPAHRRRLTAGVAVSVDDSPGGRAALRAAGGLPPGLLVTIATPAGDNVIVAGITSWHHRTRALLGWIGRCWATHPARPVAIVPGGRSRRVGG